MSETTIDKSRTARTLRNGKETTVADTTDASTTKGEGDEVAKRGGKLKLIIAAVVVLALLGGGVYQFVLAPKGAKAAAPPKPTPGAVVKLDPITLNLAGGHFLKLGLSLQATADAGEDVPGAKALDAAIEQLSGRTVAELASRSGRDKAKASLVQTVSELYEGKVYDVYFTDFVMQ
jgi:flagellar FliL protein